MAEAQNEELVDDQNGEIDYLKIAKFIIEKSTDLFNRVTFNFNNVKEIAENHSSHVFNFDDKCIIKIAKRDDFVMEKSFEVEANFYTVNRKNSYIPILYRYDDSKLTVPFVYEIIELIKGRNLYEIWPRIDDVDRVYYMRELLSVANDLTVNESFIYDWCKYIMDMIKFDYSKCKDAEFTQDEQLQIERSMRFFDVPLNAKARFSLLHNDLTFDKVMLDARENGKMKFIGFNEAMVAPIDYEVRYLYMSQFIPQYFAKETFDPVPDLNDYKEMFEWIKSYYPELNEIKCLEDRLVIYMIQYDMANLRKGIDPSAKDRILANCQKIIDLVDKRNKELEEQRYGTSLDIPQDDNKTNPNF